jgi:hypothetical protein
MVPGREYAEWMALEILDPWGDRRADWHTALICSVLANLFRDPKKRSQAFQPKDFMLEFMLDEDGELTTVAVADPNVDPEAVAGNAAAERLAAKVARINAAFGGVDLTKRREEPN